MTVTIVHRNSITHLYHLYLAECLQQGKIIIHAQINTQLPKNSTSTMYKCIFCWWYQQSLCNCDDTKIPKKSSSKNQRLVKYYAKTKTYYRILSSKWSDKSNKVDPVLKLYAAETFKNYRNKDTEICNRSCAACSYKK